MIRFDGHPRSGVRPRKDVHDGEHGEEETAPYGLATDTPGHLAALSGGDEGERQAAITHLYDAVLHQGFPETATAPAARVVGRLIATNAVDVGTRDELVDFLHHRRPRPAPARRRVRGDVVEAAIARSDTFDRIAEPATTIARQAHWTGCDINWGPLLSFAFPTPHVPDAPLSPAQRMFLHALTGNDQLWNPRNGSIALCFTRVGLPHDRKRCAQIATADGQEDAHAT
ncbi:hypothetical protein [Streptosporangium longisporum]|uniref:hypothetical protein n=1 Tax=Streptosporangium longisporum TaxID=46187 RepID=UPI0031E8FB2A